MKHAWNALRNWILRKKKKNRSNLRIIFLTLAHITYFRDVPLVYLLSYCFIFYFILFKDNLIVIFGMARTKYLSMYFVNKLVDVNILW